MNQETTGSGVAGVGETGVTGVAIPGLARGCPGPIVPAMKRLLLLPLLVALPLFGAETPQAGSPSEKAADISKYTNSLTLSPPEGAGNVASITVRALERSHFSRLKFRDEMSAKFLERYLEALDPQRVYFLQSDYDEFAKLKTRLDDLTVAEKDVQPAYDIFNRFLQRFDQQYAYVSELLAKADFRFDSDDRFLINRKEEPRPKSVEESRKLWRDRLRYEYLTEKLNQTEIPTVASNVWRKVLGVASDAALPATLPESVKRPLGTNVVTDLESLVGKTHTAELVGRLNGGKLTRLSEVQSYLGDTLPAERQKSIVEKLTRRYNRTLRTLKRYEPDEVLQLYLDSLAHTFDPHSNYFGKSELDSFSISMNLRLFGIGATLQDEDGYTVIRSIVPGSPAEKSKQIKVGDKIVAVAQGDDGEWVDVVGEKLKHVVDQIRGAKGTRVRLTTIPAGSDDSARRIVPIIRDEVKLEDSEAKAKLVEMPKADGKSVRVGVIDLPSFYASFPVGVGGRGTTRKSTTADVAKLIKKLTAEGAEGIILDLRRNGGGSLEEAVNLTGLFIKSGPVVQVKEGNGRVMQDEDEDESVLYDGPLMVLTSRFSASASEIVAGALQDYGRAIVVGDKSTHGKGTVQTIQELGMFLPDSPLPPGAIKLTIRKFYRASGESTQLKGVEPDIVLPSVNNFLETGEASLTNALPWDTIASAGFEKVNRVQPFLARLRDRSSNRLASDKDWDYVRQEIEVFRKKQEEKAMSLNYDRRVRERNEDKARAEARKKELAARAQKEPTTWDLTLKLADEPGLPAPVGKTNSIAGKAGGDVKVAASGASETAQKGGEGHSATADDDDADEAASDSPVDVHLREAERILLDLIEFTAVLNPRKTVAKGGE